LYPALNIPNRIIDLSVVERGANLEVNFTVPPLTTEGLAVKTIGAIDLRVGPTPAEPFKVEQWADGAKRIDVPPPAKPEAVHASIPLAGLVGKEVIVAVRLANSKGRVSEWSNRATIQVAPPIDTPADFTATAVAQGVLLKWKGAGTQFRIYRDTEKEPQPTLLTTTADHDYLDTTTSYGIKYEYFVQGTIADVESDPAGPKTITPVDVFPPAVPAGLEATAGLNAIELAWERNTEPDFKGYRIFRSTAGAPFEMIAEGIESPNYSDKKVESGKKYRYAIEAIDQAGNASAKCAPAEITAP
jgi:hypothetical protein